MQNKQLGFTLVELIITTAVIGILSSIMIVSLSGSKVQKQVEAEAMQLESIIRKAQNYALTGKGAFSLTNGSCPYVRVTLSGTTTQLQSADAAGACGALSETYTMQNGVTAVADATVAFSVPYGNVSAVAGGAELTAGNVRFTVTKGGKNYSVCVYPLGRIERAIGVTCP